MITMFLICLIFIIMVNDVFTLFFDLPRMQRYDIMAASVISIYVELEKKHSKGM